MSATQEGITAHIRALDSCRERERMVTPFCARKTGRFSFSFSNHRSSLYDLSYIPCTLQHLRVYCELTMWPAPSWLDSSVGRALHWYRRGHGFEPVQASTFFRLKFHNCLRCVHNYDDQSCLHIFSAVRKNQMVGVLVRLTIA